MHPFTTRELIVETVNRLFVYTDNSEWEKLQDEVFDAEVFLDMSSLGGPTENFTAKAICDMWDEGFRDLDAVNHLGGNYMVNLIDEENAEVHAYATATHFKAAAKNGQTREFVGTYDLKMRRNKSGGWRIYAFTYNLKYMQGNTSLE